METVLVIVSFSDLPTLSLLEALFLMIIAVIDKVENITNIIAAHHAVSEIGIICSFHKISFTLQSTDKSRNGSVLQQIS